jgi:sugar phosphate isomerase/epimerase
MKMHRRGFIKQTAAVGGGISLAGAGSLGASAVVAAGASSSQLTARSSGPAAARGNPIGVSTYSFSRYNGERTTVLQCIDIAAEMGFDGVEILHNQMDDESNAAFQALKARAHTLGMTLMGFSTHQGFLYPEASQRQENIDRTIRQLQLANAMGIPTMRINTGRWGMTRSFNQLMEDEGIEPIPDGLTEEMGFEWTIDSIERILPKAEEYGVVMGLENHWGLGRTAAGVLRIVETIDSPWLQITLDTGNFFEDRFAQIQTMAASHIPITLVQAKTYYGGGRWYTLDIDYARIAAMLRDAGYQGWVSLEFEGREDSSTGVPRSLELLRQHFS